MYLGSIYDQVWEVTENDYVIIDPNDPSNQDKINKQCNTMALNTIYNTIDSKVFEQIKDCERANGVCKRLEETYEGTPAVKSAKLYILKVGMKMYRWTDITDITLFSYFCLDSNSNTDSVNHAG